MKKVLLIMGLLLSTSTHASCNFEIVKDVNNWYSNYQVPEASQIKVIQVLDKSFVFLDSYKMVLDVRKTSIDYVHRGESLKSFMNRYGYTYIGKIARVEFESTRGFPMVRDVYAPVTTSDIMRGCVEVKERYK